MIDLKGQVVLNLCILNINFTGIFFSYSTVVVPTLDRGMTVCCSFFMCLRVLTKTKIKQIQPHLGEQH